MEPARAVSKRTATSSPGRPGPHQDGFTLPTESVMLLRWTAASLEIPNEFPFDASFQEGMLGKHIQAFTGGGFRTDCEQWIANVHRSSPSNVHAIGCHIFEDLIVAGRGHLFIAGNIYRDADILPAYWRIFSIDQQNIDVAELDQSSGTHFPDPALVIMGDGGRVYGHVLIEMLLRLELASAMGLSGYPVLISTHMAGWAKSILRKFFLREETEVIEHDFGSSPVSLAHGLVPTQLWNSHYFHPVMNLIVDRVLSRISIAGGKEFATKTRPDHNSLAW